MDFINSVFYKQNTYIPEIGITAKQQDYTVYSDAKYAVFIQTNIDFFFHESGFFSADS